MRSRHNLCLSLGLVLVASSIARADVLELTKEGAVEVAKIEQANAGKYGGRAIIQRHIDPRAGSQFGFVRGMIVVEHGQAGDMSFTGPGATELNSEPEKYFKFRPYNWIARNGNNVSWNDFRFEWKWISSVRQEIDTLDDLCALASWRCQAAQGADPVAAMEKGLGWFLGQLSSNAPPTNQAHEGAVTRYLLYGAMTSGERGTRIHDCRKQTGPIGEYGKFDQNSQKGGWSPRGVKYTPMDPDWSEETAEAVVARLIEAMARCQKAAPGNKGTLYNIPFSDQIQACARQFGRFLTADLARVPATATDEKSVRIRAFAFRARATLMQIVESATPERVAAKRQRPVHHGGGVPAPGAVVARPGEKDIDAQLRHSAADDDMPVTIFDMANAALDVAILMRDAHDDDRARVVGSLLRVSAGAQAFNGGVQNLQVQDWIGYRAIQTLSSLADPDPLNADEQKLTPDLRTQRVIPFRDELVDSLANPANQMRSNAARAALVRAEVDGAALIRELQALFEIALAANSPARETFYESPASSGNFLPHSASDPRREDATYVIKCFARRSSEANQAVGDRLRRLRVRQDTGTGSSEEKKFLDQFSAN